MSPFFPYVMALLLGSAGAGLCWAILACVNFSRWAREQIDTQSRLSAADAAHYDNEHKRLAKAVQRLAGELQQHRLATPPPRVSSPPRAPVNLGETSGDWADDARKTQVFRPVERLSEPPPLPAFDRSPYRG